MGEGEQPAGIIRHEHIRTNEIVEIPTLPQTTPGDFLRLITPARSGRVGRDHVLWEGRR